jgi:hypothetical protein
MRAIEILDEHCAVGQQHWNLSAEARLVRDRLPGLSLSSSAVVRLRYRSGSFS